MISQEALEVILANLPNANALPIQAQRSGRQQSQTPVPTLSAPSPQPPSSSFANLNVNGSNGNNASYAPQSPPANVQPPQQAQPPPAYPQAPAPPSALTYASALYAYKPSDSYDLELAAGDRIAVTEFMNEEWWKGRSERTGQEGIFPRNYVRVEEKLPQSNGKASSYGNMPMDVANGSGDPGRVQGPNKTQEMGKKFGKKMGNAAIFGAGATIGSNIVNSIF